MKIVAYWIRILLLHTWSEDACASADAGCKMLKIGMSFLLPSPVPMYLPSSVVAVFSGPLQFLLISRCSDAGLVEVTSNAPEQTCNAAKPSQSIRRLLGYPRENTEAGRYVWAGFFQQNIYFVMVIPSLCLDDALENSPQTQCLLKVFEEDTSLLNSFTRQLQSHLELLVSAQADVAASMEQLAGFLGTYSNFRFPLTWNNEEFPALLAKFQGTVAELGSWMELMVQQLQNCVLYPINKFISRLDELRSCKESYYGACHDLNSSLMRIVRLARKEPAKKVEEVNAEYGSMRRRFHHVGLRYFVLLNSVQYQRRIALIEPLLSILYSYRTLFRMGEQALSHGEELDDFFTRVQEQIQSFHVEQQAEAQASQEYLKTLEEISRLQPDMYHSVGISSQEPFDDRLRHKQGYLFLKSKSALITRWDQMYFHTENGNLMCQSKDDIGSRVLFEINETVHATEAVNEDRRNCFVVALGNDVKRQFVFQTLSEKECKEWISAINNIASVVGGDASAATIGDENEPILDDTEHEDVSKNVEVDVLSSPIQFDMFGLSDADSRDGTSDGGKSAKQETSAVEVFAQFDAKFLGSIGVNSDRSEIVAVEAIRQVIRARMQHNIIRAVDIDFVLLKRPPELRLIDKDSCIIKAVYQLEDLAYWTVYQNNERMFAFIVRQKGERADGQNLFTCHVVESTGTETAEEICNVLGESVKSILQSFPA
uniref:PH domain-containing protein n=1 Tax=Trichuris muris TaxID=70415 RepID=A0A5S6R0F9_TRIMR